MIVSESRAFELVNFFYVSLVKNREKRKKFIFELCVEFCFVLFLFLQFNFLRQNKAQNMFMLHYIDKCVYRKRMQKSNQSEEKGKERKRESKVIRLMKKEKRVHGVRNR